MSQAHPLKLKEFLFKKKRKKLSGSRHVHGTLQGFHPFMNLLIDEHVEMATRGQQNNTGMVVMQGNGVIMFEALE
nr:small nuclear ribonucleoprotein G-like [Marmota flaviventris]